MSDDLEQFMMSQHPTADRPLLGSTVLVVEDSRFASEAIRLLSLRSGARIRRADSLGAAHRHLSVYRPSVVIIDMGLPDGCGTDLIGELAADPVRVPALLAMSGDETARNAALAAGADGFLAKPVESLAVFQNTILSILSATKGPISLRAVPKDVVSPDKIAFQDDLSHAAALMRKSHDSATEDYIAQFIGAAALSAHDAPLEAAASRLARSRSEGRGTGSDWAHIADLVQDRLAGRRAL